MQKSSQPALTSIRQLLKYFGIGLLESKRPPRSSKSSLCEWGPQVYAVSFLSQAHGPSGLRHFTAFPAPDVVEDDFWEEGNPLSPPHAAQRPVQAPCEAHYRLWAELSNLRDQGYLIQAERRGRGKMTPYAYAPLKAYQKSLRGMKGLQFDDTVLDLWARQVQNEYESAEHAYEKFMQDSKEKQQSGMGAGLGSVRRFLNAWHKDLERDIEAKQKQARFPESSISSGQDCTRPCLEPGYD